MQIIEDFENVKDQYRRTVDEDTGAVTYSRDETTTTENVVLATDIAEEIRRLKDERRELTQRRKAVADQIEDAEAMLQDIAAG